MVYGFYIDVYGGERILAMLRILRQGEDWCDYSECFLQEKVYEDIAILRMSVCAGFGGFAKCESVVQLVC